MRKEIRNEILKEFAEEIKAMVRNLLESLMREEREVYLGEHPTKANGYYTRDLLTLADSIEDLKVPRVREGDFHPRILPYRKRASVDLSEAILVLYAVGVSTRNISRFLEGVYGAFYSPQSISRLLAVTKEEVKSWRERPLAEEYYAVFLDGTFLSIRRGKTAKEPVYMALGIKPDGRREILGFWLFGAEGESAQNWEEVLKNLRRRGVQRVRIFITDDLPGLEEAIRKIFPEADWQLCVLHAVREALNKARKADREALAEDLKRVYRAETEEEARKALQKLRERWGVIYPKIVERFEAKAYALLAFLRHPKSIRRYLYTTNQLERLAKEVKRRTKVVEVFCGEEAVEKLLYLVLSHLNEAWGARRLRGFAEIEMGSYHADQTH
ncbi:IS256 family transposase [Candidatus Bipolaricaulota bacterium]|nr:IS256 family transposase [Candidatus Bipolaricaulota bacterium]